VSYTPPTLPLNVTWEGTDAYTAPTLPLDVSWQPAAPATITGHVLTSTPRPTTTATATVGASPAVTGTARPTAYRPAVTASGVVPIVAQIRADSHQPLATVAGTLPVVGRLTATGHRPAATATGAIIVTGALSALGHRPAGTATGTVPIVGSARPAAHHPTLTAEGTVLRYVLRGAVRNQGVLVERTVRAHRLDDGALAGEVQTVGGLFDLDVGFGADDYYVLALDLAPEGTDYAPPIANRVRSVLVQDAPA
jgi:hypothetical protein